MTFVPSSDRGLLSLLSLLSLVPPLIRDTYYPFFFFLYYSKFLYITYFNAL